MHRDLNSYVSSNLPIPLYSSEQVYAIERAWFDQGYSSFGLMQQAAWQMTQYIIHLYEQKYQCKRRTHRVSIYPPQNKLRRVSIWIGKGNNGGDGWLTALYLQQLGWQVEVITVGFDTVDVNIPKKGQEADFDDHEKDDSISDALKARHKALAANCDYRRFESIEEERDKSSLSADIYIDALFGIGLQRQPTGVFKRAIEMFNGLIQRHQALAIAVDIPSGLVASTGQVFDRVAVKADITLCLVARKFGLHTKDGQDYSGEIIDVPLIPIETTNEACKPIATLLTAVFEIPERRQNSYKGTFGHVLIIGGNQVAGSQGMGGAAILAAASTMAVGAGKITVACHDAFHGALLTSLPNAMAINLHDEEGVKNLIKDTNVVAIGMGLGRDNSAKMLFSSYIIAIMAQGKSIVIDADGLYHLASLYHEGDALVTKLRDYSQSHEVYLTPHSGEAARLLDKTVESIEDNRIEAIKACAKVYGGDWVLKGAGSLVLEQIAGKYEMSVCGVGNAGMATAGMGDVLSGVAAGWLAQQDVNETKVSHQPHGLHQAVLIHGLAGDVLIHSSKTDEGYNNALLIGQRGLQAQDMPNAIRHIVQLSTISD